MSQREKKKLVDKIRNKASAKRSRIRQKLKLKSLEDEVHSLKCKIEEVESENRSLRLRNSDLENRLSKYER